MNDKFAEMYPVGQRCIIPNSGPLPNVHWGSDHNQPLRMLAEGPEVLSISTTPRWLKPKKTPSHTTHTMIGLVTFDWFIGTNHSPDCTTQRIHEVRHPWSLITNFPWEIFFTVTENLRNGCEENVEWTLSYPSHDSSNKNIHTAHQIVLLHDATGFVH